MNKKITFHKVENYPGSDNRFRFRVYDKEEKKYVSLCFHATLHNSFLEVGDWQIIEQCTGLKDKNGKLIFEGDIVRYNDMKNGTVVFKNGCFVWDWKVNDPPIYGLDNIELEVIGNIHETEVAE